MSIFSLTNTLRGSAGILWIKRDLTGKTRLDRAAEKSTRKVLLEGLRTLSPQTPHKVLIKGLLGRSMFKTPQGVA